MQSAGGGFTLIEILLVAAIIALMATSMGGFCYNTYRRMLVEKGARGLYLSARYARLLAVEKQTPCRLIMSEENKSFCLAFESGNSQQEDKSLRLVTDAYASPTTFEGNVVFEDIKVASAWQSELDADADAKSVVFYPDGTADTAVIQVGDGESHYAVYVLAATGKARVKFGEAIESPVEIVDLDDEQL